MSDGEQQQKSSGGFVHTMTKRALAPVAATAATAATAFLTRKGTELWHEKVKPKLDARGGASTAARDALESVGDKPPSTEQLGELKEKVGGASSTKSETAAAEDTERDEERRKREQRRSQRRKSLDKARSS